MLKTNTERWPGRLVLMLGHIAGMIDLVALPVWVGTALIGQYHFSAPLAGSMVTGYLVAVVAGSLVFAPRFHRLAAHRVAPMGYAMAAGVFVLLTTTANPALMIALHVLAGFSVGTALSFTHGTIGRSARPHRLFAIVTIGLGVSGLVFLGVAQSLVPVHGGAVLFAMFAALMGIAAIATAVAFPRPSASETADANKETQGATARPIGSRVWLGIAGLTLMTLSQSTIFSFLERIGTARGFAERVQGVLIASAVVNLAAAALAGALEGRIVPARAALCGAVLQATLAAILVFSGGFAAYAFSGIFFVSVIIVTHTFVFGWLASHDASGRSVALTPAMVMSGAAIGPLMGGLLVAGFGIPSLGIVALVIAVIAFTCYRLAFARPSPGPGGAVGRLGTHEIRDVL
jgi:predicted MFS family arabinose efflux permease